MATESKVKGVAAALTAAKGKNSTPKKAPAKKRARKTSDKAPAKKTPKKKPPKTEGAAPTSGQSGPPIELSLDRLNSKERRVLDTLNEPPVAPMTIEELAETCFKSQGKKRSNSWVRNSLRRLVQGGLVEKVSRGSYRISETGKKRLAVAA